MMEKEHLKLISNLPIEESKKESCPDSLEDILNEMVPYFEIFFPNIRCWFSE